MHASYKCMLYTRKRGGGVGGGGGIRHKQVCTRVDSGDRTQALQIRSLTVPLSDVPHLAKREQPTWAMGSVTPLQLAFPGNLKFP